ncbi:MAG TPA: cytochrome c-type biogenesis protein [Pelomicrobium sp.]|nr:cytochrome c-type biogenesis protein [Pelomicrobium sp.]
MAPTGRTLRAAASRAAAASLAAIVACSGFAQSADAEAETRARFARLAAELRCLVCQNQSLADSQAGLAVDLKNQVMEMIEAGRSDREIVDYLTARYGDFVLYRPPLKPSTLLLWGGPLALLFVGVALAARRAVRWHVAEEPAEPLVDAGERDRIAALLKQDEASTAPRR